MLRCVLLCGVLAVLGQVGVGYKHGNETEVVLAQVIFRHGERTTYKFYPTDPYRNITFYPIGLGGLTNRGKFGEYLLGRFLRKEYDSLLGQYYAEDMLEARSTDTVRTKMSAQLVLAGMFPPSEQQRWNPELNWQPIPVNSKSRHEEDLLHPEECAKKLWLLGNIPTRPEIQDVYVKPYEKLFNYIEEKSGLPIRNVHDLIEFYFIVKTEDDMNLALPSWVKSIYPEPLYSTSALAYSYFNIDDELKRINSGYLLKKMLNDVMLKITSPAHSNMKMYLYSGHETTIGHFLYGLRILKPHIPAYGSAVLFELHKNVDDKYFIKIRYRDGPDQNIAKDLTVPGCDVLCPLQQFIGLHKSLIPTLSLNEACKLAA